MRTQTMDWRTYRRTDRRTNTRDMRTWSETTRRGYEYDNSGWCQHQIPTSTLQLDHYQQPNSKQGTRTQNPPTRWHVAALSDTCNCVHSRKKSWCSLQFLHLYQDWQHVGHAHLVRWCPCAEEVAV